MLRIARARECFACHVKRQVIQYYKPTAYRGDLVHWQMCAPCIIEALKYVVARNMHRPRAKDKPRAPRERKTPK